MKQFILSPLFFIILLGLTGCEPQSNESETATQNKIVKYPEKIDPKCRGGTAKIYDECSNQIAIYDAALQKANEQGKTLLVSYGAEWCIWCHVFESHINGETTTFDYTFGYPDNPDEKFTSTLHEREETDVSQEAFELNEFFRNNFIIAHIEGHHAPNGTVVLDRTNASQQYGGGLPFIFTTDREGQIATAFTWDKTEIKRKTDDWYYGFDRKKLLKELQRMKDAAVN